jgi:hypothetical protein
MKQPRWEERPAGMLDTVMSVIIIIFFLGISIVTLLEKYGLISFE